MQHGYDKHSRDPSTRARIHARIAQDDKFLNFKLENRYGDVAILYRALRGVKRAALSTPLDRFFS